MCTRTRGTLRRRSITPKGVFVVSKRWGLYPVQCRDTEPLCLQILPSQPKVLAPVPCISFICPQPVNSGAVTTIPRVDYGEM